METHLRAGLPARSTGLGTSCQSPTPSQPPRWFCRVLSAESPGRGGCGQSRKVGQGLPLPAGWRNAAVGTQPGPTGLAPGQGLAAALLRVALACRRRRRPSLTCYRPSRVPRCARQGLGLYLCPLGLECSTLTLGGLEGAVMSGITMEGGSPRKPSSILGEQDQGTSWAPACAAPQRGRRARSSRRSGTECVGGATLAGGGGSLPT